jgi:ADP-heptose:LPS heptosyltransferase
VTVTSNQTPIQTQNPAQTQAPVLLFPTHYLGNFVLGLPWVCEVLKQHPDAPVVLDSRFAPLAAMVLGEDVNLISYPRDKIAKNQKFASRLRHYLGFLGALRRNRRDTLLDLEGERFTGVLAWLSGCKRRVGPTGKHAQHFYTDVRDLDYLRHRFNAFGEIAEGFTSGQAPSSVISYRVSDEARLAIQQRIGATATLKPLVAIHPGASVDYKLWPRAYFATLVGLLEASGYQPVWVGAGSMDANIIAEVQALAPNSSAVDLCNALSFAELVTLYRCCRFFIGSDSGPMHLAASTGLPLYALFGPSKEAICAPLGPDSHVLRGNKSCGESCDAHHCDFDYHCLTSLQPERVMAAIERFGQQPPAKEKS